MLQGTIVPGFLAIFQALNKASNRKFKFSSSDVNISDIDYTSVCNDNLNPFPKRGNWQDDYDGM
jgi:hypothetical protein